MGRVWGYTMIAERVEREDGVHVKVRLRLRAARSRVFMWSTSSAPNGIFYITPFKCFTGYIIYYVTCESDSVDILNLLIVFLGMRIKFAVTLTRVYS